MIELIEARAPLSGWTADAVAMLAPHALPSRYPSLGPDDESRLEDAYGSNTARLLDVKIASILAGPS